MSSTQSIFTKEQKDRIYETIFQNMQGDDRYPCEVIHDKFKGDEKEYLQTMACYHGIAL